MNFLLRSPNSTVSNLASVPEDRQTPTRSLPAKTLEGLIAEDPFSSLREDSFKDSNEGDISTFTAGLTADQASIRGHIDVSEDNGWIVIPCKELPKNWSDVSDVRFFDSLDRQFVFPGEQLHILACLSVPKQDAIVTTPPGDVEVMEKNGSHNLAFEGIRSMEIQTNADIKFNGDHQEASSRSVTENYEHMGITDMTKSQLYVYDTESSTQINDSKQRTQILLEKFKNSHYFVRIAESNEPLWSKRLVPEVNGEEQKKLSGGHSSFSTFVDTGNFDGSVSGVARNSTTCCSLHNGDIVVLLEVNVGVDKIKDPVLEILQFEKFESSKVDHVSYDNHRVSENQDPYRELLTWLIPVDRVLPSPGRSPSPSLTSSPGIGSASQKSGSSPLSGSQLFSFGNLRSYSMSAIPQAAPPPSVHLSPNRKPNSGLEDFDRFSSDGTPRKLDFGTDGVLSFRGVPLDPERFSSACGLEGIYIPAWRWRKKLEIIQPIEIHTFAAECNTEDLLCVQVKNVSPAHEPEIVIFIDAITVVYEEAPKDSPIYLPVSCIEAGNEYSLPNISLRRGEEHSFILKPANSMARDPKGYGKKNSLAMSSTGMYASTTQKLIAKVAVGKRLSSTDQYAVVVSCRCNYTESKLFFKKSTSWRPRFSRDLMVSVTSEISAQSFGPSGGSSQLPVQEMTLQASNLTNEDLTLTVLAPASFTSPPSIMSLNSSPTSPLTPLASIMQRFNPAAALEKKQEENATDFSFVPNSGDLSCSHLWLQSIVPLGCVPARSSATVKLELLPLTDGIISLDTLQISVKEKGIAYMPEHPLKIHATSSIATCIS